MQIWATLLVIATITSWTVSASPTARTVAVTILRSRRSGTGRLSAVKVLTRIRSTTRTSSSVYHLPSRPSVLLATQDL
ncbi:hypothetical protein GGR56DRAFT_661217 [Xylariaceae sp. FL0804]|nr:hypothetical protein GGR56DRAFT_661217 [Xylariaceae sp. FL0804]